MNFHAILEPSTWCAPAVIYALFSLIGLVMLIAGLALVPLSMNKWILAAVWLAVSIIFMYLFLYLCSKGLNWVAWLLLLLPLILSIFSGLSLKK